MSISLALLVTPVCWGQAAATDPEDEQAKEVTRLLNLLTDYYDDLLTEDPPYIPTWLPDELKIKPKAG